MNKDFILFNLKWARDQILQTIEYIESDPEYEFGNYLVDMTLIYEHINRAWNARDASPLKQENAERRTGTSGDNIRQR
jgi:hypothetical protein